MVAPLAISNDSFKSSLVLLFVEHIKRLLYAKQNLQSFPTWGNKSRANVWIADYFGAYFWQLIPYIVQVNLNKAGMRQHCPWR